MVQPALAARVKQRNNLAGDGISGRGLVVFVVIAALASPGETLQGSFSPFAAWFDVLAGKRLHGEAFLTSAILATTACPVGQLPSQPQTHAHFSHRLYQANRGMS